MIDFVLDIFSTMFQINMRDHHDMPFAMPLMLAIIVGGFVGYLFVRFAIKEPTEEKDPTTHY
jgi:hypothetical protein